jgi:two-component system cell cycle response regulator CpdR
MAKFMLAEDDDSIRHFLGLALERAGHEVFSVSQGDEVLPVLAEGRFDLLLADIVMPEFDGLELARRAVAVDPAIRIVFITGFTAVALCNRQTSCSDAKVLSKPFHLRDLVDEIDKTLDA